MAFSDYPRSASAVTTIGGAAMTEGATPRAGVNNALRQLAADGRNLSDKLAAVYNGVCLYQYLSEAQEADIAAGTGTLDCTTAMQTAIAAAAGKPVIMPVGRTRIDGKVTYQTTSTSPFTQGMKVIGHGPGFTVIDYRGADACFEIDTDTSYKFQDNCIFKGFDLTGEYGGTTGHGILMRRAYNVVIDDVEIEHLDGDGIKVRVDTNDADSSNLVTLSRSYIHDIAGWGFNHDSIPGGNDLSFFQMRDSRFNKCGTDARKTITAITQANPGSVTCTAHGFTSGDKILIGGVFGMAEANLKPFTITVVDANTFTIGVNTTSWTAYASGGKAFPLRPTSGGIRLNAQMGSIYNSYCTETRNVGLLIDGVGTPAFRTYLEQFTVENGNSLGLMVNGASGLVSKGLDLRINQTYATNYCHVFLDGSNRIVDAIELESTSIIAINGSAPIVTDCPHTAFQGATATDQLGAVSVTGTDWKTYDGTNQKRYGDELYSAQSLKIEDLASRMSFVTGAAVTQTFTSANPTYTPDLRLGQTHIITLGAGASGTLTVATPTTSQIPGNALAGMPLNIIIVNSSGGIINLTWGIATKSAPATVNNADTKSGNWTYATSSGWVQDSAWI